jgi:Tfp pilus assembly protein PilF
MRIVSPLVGNRRIGLLIGAVALTAAGLSAYRWREARQAGAAPGDLALVADLENETGDTLFDRALNTAATVALNESGVVSVYPRSALRPIYRLMQIGNQDTLLSFDLAQEVAERARVRFAVGLKIEQSGTGYSVSARVGDVRSHRTVAAVSDIARTKGDVMSTLDGVLFKVRRAVGESRDQAESRHVALPLVTTSSLAALRSYADGGSAWNSGDVSRANELWQRAVDLDTGFAMAYASLGSLNDYVHDRPAADRYFAEATRRIYRLSERERLVLLSHLAERSGNRDSAVAVDSALAVRFPGGETWRNYGAALMWAGRNDAAAKTLHRSLDFDANNADAWIELATVFSRMGRSDSSIAAYQRGGQIDSTWLYRNNINNEYGEQLVLAGRFAEAESLFSRMSRIPRLYERSLGFRSLGYLALWRGRLDDAITQFRLATDAVHQQRSPLSEARNRLLLASVYRMKNRGAEANAEVNQALALAGSPTLEPAMLVILAYQSLQLGRTRDVETLGRLTRERARAGNDADQACLAFADATVHAAHHRPDSALIALRKTNALPWPIPRLMLFATSFAAAGQTDSAKVMLSAVEARKNFGVEGQDDWLRAPLLLGNALLAAGDTAGAARQYQNLLTQWRDASGENPDLAAARQHLDAIAAKRPRG